MANENPDFLFWEILNLNLTFAVCRKRDFREIKIHVYRIRQTANVSGEFLRIENKQLKKVQNDSCGQNYHKTTYFCVEAINGKRKIGGKLGHVVQIHVCRLA